MGWKDDICVLCLNLTELAMARRVLTLVVTVPRVDSYAPLNGCRFTAEEKIPVFTTPVITVE